MNFSIVASTIITKKEMSCNLKSHELYNRFILGRKDYKTRITTERWADRYSKKNFE